MSEVTQPKLADQMLGTYSILYFELLMLKKFSEERYAADSTKENNCRYAE